MRVIIFYALFATAVHAQLAWTRYEGDNTCTISQLSTPTCIGADECCGRVPTSSGGATGCRIGGAPCHDDTDCCNGMCIPSTIGYVDTGVCASAQLDEPCTYSWLDAACDRNMSVSSACQHRARSCVYPLSCKTSRAVRDQLRPRTFTTCGLSIGDTCNTTDAPDNCRAGTLCFGGLCREVARVGTPIRAPLDICENASVAIMLAGDVAPLCRFAIASGGACTNNSRTDYCSAPGEACVSDVCA
jgi:hypothetical protein